MSDDYMTILRRHDDPDRWEYPKGFDYASAVQRFRDFVADIQRVFAARFVVETESHIQDASFHSQIDIGGVWLRFSNFGDMVAVTDDTYADPDTLLVIEERLLKHGYQFVPNLVLNQPYTGTNPGVTGIRTWWIRYFDWV